MTCLLCYRVQACWNARREKNEGGSSSKGKTATATEGGGGNGVVRADSPKGEGQASNGPLMLSEGCSSSDGGSNNAEGELSSARQDGSGNGGDRTGLSLDDDDEDDMPATLERLGGAGGDQHHQQQQERHSNSSGAPGKSLLANRARSFSSGSSVGESQQQQQHPPSLSLETPVPLVLSEGALSTPAVEIKEAVLERGKGKIEAPWLVDDDGGGERGLGLRLEQELDEDDVSTRSLTYVHTSVVSGLPRSSGRSRSLAAVVESSDWT